MTFFESIAEVMNFLTDLFGAGIRNLMADLFERVVHGDEQSRLYLEQLRERVRSRQGAGEEQP